LLPENELSETPCLSRHTPVRMLLHPGSLLARLPKLATGKSVVA
jgi:hypothetical protein